MKAVYRSILVATAATVLILTLGAQPVHAQARTHVVSRGENLSSIAARYGTTVQAIVTANGLANPSLIYAGQRLAIPGSGSSAGAGASGTTYTVRRGDTLSSIAQRHGTTVTALVRANGLANPSYIYPGQRLVISGGASSSSAGQASSGGSQAAGGGGVTHTVRRGDTVTSIALRYGTTVTAIVQANGLANPRLIYAGQRLRIPGGGGVTAAPAAPSGAKRIVIDLSEQRMYVYQGGQLIWKWVVSTGQAGMGTAVGHYKVQNKIANAYASTWNLQMPYWLGIYWAGSLQNGIHALPIMSNGQLLWAGYLGSPASYGCVILGTNNARTLYNWASVGTPVDIAW